MAARNEAYSRSDGFLRPRPVTALRFVPGCHIYPWQAVLAALIQYVDALKTQAVCATLLDGMMLQGALE